MLKKILLALILVVATTVTHADPIGISDGGGTPDPGVQYCITDPEEDEVVEEEDNGMKIAASKAYVDTMVETRQDKIPAAGQPNVGAGETVMTYTSTGNGQIGERGLYSDISSYNASTDGDKLITASALNATFTNLPTTPTTKLECANQADGCTLWTIVDQTAYARGLPAEYTRLEYIQSTGTQYIDTGIKQQDGDEVGLVYKQITLDTSYRNLFGAAASGSSGAFFISQTSSTTYVGNVSNGNIPRDTNKHTLSWVTTSSSSQNVVIDGQTYVVSVLIIPTPNLNVMVFARNASQDKMIGKVYGYYQKRNGEYLINLVPAKNSNNVIGMYDTVSGTFFTNSGTGDFAGPAAN